MLGRVRALVVERGLLFWGRVFRITFTVSMVRSLLVQESRQN